MSKIERILLVALLAAAGLPLEARGLSGVAGRSCCMDRNASCSSWAAGGEQRVMDSAEDRSAVVGRMVPGESEDAQAGGECAVAEPDKDKRVAAERQNGEPASQAPYHLALRANLLRWATLTPDLGLAWRVSRHMSIVVNGSYTSWSWNDKKRRYALWEVTPEIRCHLGEKKIWYVGALFKSGGFNYKLSETGRQGSLMGGGITGGCQLNLNRALAFDFNLGIGYLNADYDKYELVDGVRLRRGKGSKNWWGPVNAGVTLVWKLF